MLANGIQALPICARRHALKSSRSRAKVERYHDKSWSSTILAL